MSLLHLDVVVGLGFPALNYCLGVVATTVTAWANFSMRIGTDTLWL